MVTKKHLTILAAAAAIGPGTHATAQTIQGGFELRVSNVVSPSQPTATVEVWAWFDNVPGVSEVFGGTNFDLTASDGDWPANLWVFPFGTPTGPPVVRGSSIIGVGGGQIHLPSLGIFGDPANPIHVFSADWATSDFTLRTVSVITENTTFFGVYSQSGVATMIPLSNVVAGSGSLVVVPAPSIGALFLIGSLPCFRRRRL